MSDATLTACCKAFLYAFREHVLKYHPEQDTALVRDLAQNCFTRKLAECLKLVGADPPPTVEERSAILKRVKQSLDEASRKLRAGVPDYIALGDFYDSIITQTQSTLF